ncbi:MAG: hypothetical protein AAB417_02760 [Patescibacteria group bacterium]
MQNFFLYLQQLALLAKDDPASILLLLTLLFSMLIVWWGRKKTRLELIKTESLFSISITNASKDWRIQIGEYGYKTWNGLIRRKGRDSVNIDGYLGPSNQINLDFFEDGRPELIDTKAIYYIYAEDTTGKVYRKYSKFFLISWIIRLFFWVKSKTKTP